MSTPNDHGPAEDGRPESPPLPAAPPLGPGEFGAMPPPSDAEAGIAGPIPPPTTVRVSFWIWIASAVLQIVFSLVALANRQSLIDSAMKTRPANADPAQFRSAVELTVTVAGITAIVFAVLYVGFAYLALRGRNWARVTLTALTVVFGLFDLLGGASPATALSVLVSVIAVILLYLPSARDYFVAMKRRA